MFIRSRRQNAARLMAIGWSGEICKIDDSRVVKYPKFFPNDPSYNEFCRDQIVRESNIYERLGKHEGVIKYPGIADNETGAIKLAYAKQGDLSTYIQNHDIPSQPFRDGWIQSLMETFRYIYDCKVLHQVIKFGNILVDNDTLKVIGFAGGAIFPADADMEAVCAADPLSRIDLLCLGSIFYSIATWQVFSYDYFEKDRWPTPDELPVVHKVPWGEIIQKCWDNRYDTVASLSRDVSALLVQTH